MRVSVEGSAARYSRYSQILTLLGLLGCVSLYEFVIAKQLPLWPAILVIPVAAWVVQRRHQCHLKSVELQNLLEYYEKGSARLTRKWDSLDGGDRFKELDHFYAEDLNLFGEGSLYQLLCSARNTRWAANSRWLDEIARGAGRNSRTARGNCRIEATTRPA